jgi:peptidoglycan/xylan/chitin deacetylase (PgdA/CDA1 family)
MPRNSPRRSVLRVVLVVVTLLSTALSAVGVPAEPAEAVALPWIPATVAAPGGLNLRTGPSSTRPTIRTLPNGAALSVIGTSSDWFKVVTGGRTGWVNSWYVTLSGRSSAAITRGNTARRMVALTFDAGADLGNTEWIITTLERHGIPATFSLTGSWLNQNPGYAQWIAADGFQIMNHTLNHPSFTGYSTGKGPISPAKRLSQLVANESRLLAITGVGTAGYWRPPYGDYDASVLRDVGSAGYGRTILWTIDTMGWNGASADRIVSTVGNGASNGAIILMHVGAASQDAAALERIITTLRSRGYAFGTVAQVLAQ